MLWEGLYDSAGQSALCRKEEMMEQVIEQGVFYLKKCLIALKWAERLAPLMSLCRQLKDEGIDCQVMLSEELWEYRKNQGLLSPEEEEGILYLTDDAGVYSSLAEESGREPPVLIYLHPDNANEDFGNARYAADDKTQFGKFIAFPGT